MILLTCFGNENRFRNRHYEFRTAVFLYRDPYQRKGHQEEKEKYQTTHVIKATRNRPFCYLGAITTTAMKAPIAAAIAIILTGCMQTRYITERYIKNDIEVHTPGTTSGIRTYSIYKSMQSSSSNRYVELTGYKFNDQKGLVIGADRYYRTVGRSTGIPIDLAQYTYVALSESEARAMHDHIEVIRNKVKSEAKPKPSEEVYSDYTVNKDLFISVRRSAATSGKTYIYLWVKGEKYTLTSTTLPKKLKKFLDY